MLHDPYGSYFIPTLEAERRKKIDELHLNIKRLVYGGRWVAQYDPHAPRSFKHLKSMFYRVPHMSQMQQMSMSMDSTPMSSMNFPPMMTQPMA